MIIASIFAFSYSWIQPDARNHRQSIPDWPYEQSRLRAFTTRTNQSPSRQMSKLKYMLPPTGMEALM